MTVHMSAHQVVGTGAAAPGRAPSKVLLRTDLMRTDEGPTQGETVLYVQGESDAELNAVGVDLLIADLEAAVAKLRVFRRQMGA